MMGGLSYMTGPKGRPLRAGTSVNDIMGGMFGAIGVLAALRERDRTGRGQEIQSALFENCVFLCAAAHAAVLDDRRAAAADALARLGLERLRRVHARRRRAALHRRGQRQAVPDAVPRDRAPELAADSGLSDNAKRVAVRPELLRRLGEILQHHRIEELSPKLEAAGIPYAPIVRPEQLLDDPHLRESGGLVKMQTDDGGATDVVLLPLTLGGRRPGVRRPLARVGEHTDEVLARLAATP